MPFTSTGFAALRFKVAQYVLSVAPDTSVSLEWPEQPPTPADPDFTFVIRFKRREVTVTLSAHDVTNGSDWRVQIDDAMNRVTLG